jgi:uncharacterized protein (TIGR03437 family)
MKLASVLLFLVFRLAGQSQAPNVTNVINFAAGRALSPSSYAFIFGTNLGANPSVFLGNTLCELYYFNDTFVSLQIPAGAATGAATLTVQTAAGSSAPFSVTITPTSPAIVAAGLTEPFSYFFNLASPTKLPTPSPGDFVFLFVDGVGPTRPPVAPVIQIDGNNVPVLETTTLLLPIGNLAASMGQVPAFAIQIPSLAGGPHTLRAIAGALTSSAVMFTSIARGLYTSQTGLTFQAVQGGPGVPSQSFSVLTGTGTANFSLTTSTISGGSWLSATPLVGTTTVATAGAPIQVQANASNLAIGTYYGRVTIASPDVPNSPQVVTVVLNVSAKGSPSISKTGLIFTGTASGANPPSQTITAFNPAAASVSFTSSLQGAGAGSLQVTPATGNIASGQSQALAIQAVSGNVPAGAVSAKLTLSFSDGTTRTVNLLLILIPGALNSSSFTDFSNAAPRAIGFCAPTKLLPVFTLLGDSFSVAAAWPTPVEATILDDCGVPMVAGEAVVSFSNGDPPLRLDATAAGVWSATWPPQNPRASGVGLTLTAVEAATKLTGTAQISGGVNANPGVPQVTAGGVVETAAYGSPVAPGDLVAIFGAELSAAAASATAVPLPNQLLSTAVLIDGQFIPMFYTSSGQVNAVVPYGLPVNARHQLVVQRDNSLSVPQSVLVGVARPGVYTVDASGSGQGQIYKVDAAGNQILTDKNAPAKAGDTLVIYCSGLGAVNPQLSAGTATPLTFLTNTVDPLTVTIGGKSAVVLFSGLTPGSTGLYQVNAVVPEGLSNSDTTSLQITISGQDSATVTLSVRM